MSEQIKGYVRKLFLEMNNEVDNIIKTTANNDIATRQITDYVSSCITAESNIYISTLYSKLSKETLKEPIFNDATNANKFYDLDLRHKMMAQYQFNVGNLDAFDNKIDFKEINRLYSSAAVAVGSTAVGGILLGSLSGVVKIPMVVVIAGAVLVGIGAGAYTGIKYVPERNKENYRNSVKKTMNELETEMLFWIDSVVDYYNQQVNALKQSL